MLLVLVSGQHGAQYSLDLFHAHPKPPRTCNTREMREEPSSLAGGRLFSLMARDLGLSTCPLVPADHGRPAPILSRRLREATSTRVDLRCTESRPGDPTPMVTRPLGLSPTPPIPPLAVVGRGWSPRWPRRPHRQLRPETAPSSAPEPLSTPRIDSRSTLTLTLSASSFEEHLAIELGFPTPTMSWAFVGVLSKFLRPRKNVQA